MALPVPCDDPFKAIEQKLDELQKRFKTTEQQVAELQKALPICNNEENLVKAAVQKMSIIQLIKLKREGKDCSWEEQEDDCEHICALTSGNDGFTLCAHCGKLTDTRDPGDMRPFAKKLADAGIKANAILCDYYIQSVTMKDPMNKGCEPRNQEEIEQLRLAGVDIHVIDKMANAVPNEEESNLDATMARGRNTKKKKNKHSTATVRQSEQPKKRARRQTDVAKSISCN